MRIGIVTQPLELNYGGILQNWALQRVFSRMGHDPLTIDAYQRFTAPHYVVSWLRAWWMRLCGNKKYLYPQRYHGALRRESTGRFVEQHISKTKVMWDYDRKVVAQYGLEALVVGSHQVWRSSYNKQHLGDMFLEFAEGLPVKRVAYAASFGVDQWSYTPQQTSKCAELLQQFDAVSVREASGVALCRDHLGVEAQHVLDPTLLLKAADYQAIVDTTWDAGEPYLAVYCLDVTPVKRAFVQQLASERGLRLRMFSAGVQAELSIEQWLAMFKNAELVVTDSFHGTVFSILFGREFYSLGNHRRGNARIQELLQTLGLDDRLLSDTEPTQGASGEIDWSVVNHRLDKARQESLEFLRNALA